MQYPILPLSVDFHGSFWAHLAILTSLRGKSLRRYIYEQAPCHRVEKSAFLFPSRDLGLQNVPQSA